MEAWQATNSIALLPPHSMLFGLMKQPRIQQQIPRNLWKLFRGSHKFNQHQI